MKQAANLDVQDLDRTTKTRTITIDPVTRIEGHARVFINQGAHGEIESAGLVVNELRGFERILVGMEADRMPLITARICGVCPTAHHLAATNALDQAAGVTPPDAALLLRELMFMGHLIHSHSLSLFVLQGPDIILGLDADPAIRNVLGVVQAQPDIALKALRIRSIGQKINEMIGGRGTHPVTSVAGGITFTIDSGKLAQLTSWIDEALVLAKALVPILKDLLLKQLERNPAVTAWATSSWSLGTMKDGRVSFTDGRLTVVDDIGDPQTTFSAIDYDHFLCETVVDWSYMKPVRLKANGQFRDYRVGPMARMNVAACYGTPWADQELAYFKDTVGIPCHQTAYQPYGSWNSYLLLSEPQSWHAIHVLSVRPASRQSSNPAGRLVTSKRLEELSSMTTRLTSKALFEQRT